MECSRSGVTLAVWCVTLAAVWTALPAQAQQFVLADVEYTATAQNTSDSHYPVTPKAGIPTDWRSPVNYANGSVYVELEVLEKPGNKNTFYNICIENASNPACLPYVKYTATGKYKANFPFSMLWQYDKVDWTKGCSKVSLIIKDETEAKQQGNADYYPYKAHVVLTVVAPGATYVPPGASAPAAGSGGSSDSKAGTGGSASSAGKGGSMASAKAGSGGASASTSTGAGGKAGSASGSGGKGGSSAPADAGVATVDAGASTGAAGKASSAAIGGSGGAAKGGGSGALANQVDPDHKVTSQLESTGGCSTTGAGNRSGALPFLLGLGWLLRRRPRA